MPDRDLRVYIIDILIAINKIERYTQTFTNAQDLLYSELNWDGTLREIEIIGEATNYLLKNDILDRKYRRIVDFRNQIIHAYFGIDENIVYEVITDKLPILSKELKVLTKDYKVDRAIENAKIENRKNSNIVNFLNILEAELKSQ